MSGSPRLRVGVDTGGTFTDFVCDDGQGWRAFKLPSTPASPARAVLEGLSELAGVREVVHGTTVATNAALEGRGARTAFVTTAGFRDLLAQAAHIPVHLGSMGFAVRGVLEALTLEEGDVALLNDPYRGGTHLPDLTVVAPVFAGGQLVGYAATRAHHADLGGSSPGSMPVARSLAEEGLVIGPCKLLEHGRVNAAVLEPILAAVRTPDERRGDLDAQTAATPLPAPPAAAPGSAGGTCSSLKWDREGQSRALPPNPCQEGSPPLDPAIRRPVQLPRRGLRLLGLLPLATPNSCPERSRAPGRRATCSVSRRRAAGAGGNRRGASAPAAGGGVSSPAAYR
jgi:hypothetical protein